ncbi:hypothetical protein GA0116948_116100 [Chitinophaga costaii]|uniref:Uncharacterized protein n=1 Tax=Chitinophaga costaii TaxID=1335309 RepID=A0A1C4FS34_9BACT|nr:hypothetical protein [Chitinophaga costaii]PUZ20514.1 hypothetical protein DCM91_18960 [Chitinophaga costaii]SCC58847.1 hypothetical protein GA0116948_116100 [Chitinophaga costaii]
MPAGINISNYEAFFLRFIDGDLDAAEQAMLRHFLEQHPHLQQELQVWESTVMTPDLQVTFPHKDLLYRGRPALHAENQESYLMSYMDNELSAADREVVDAYIAATPAARAALDLLQMTRLQPDMDQVFLPKSELYRHRRRILPVYWWSVGAAAVVAGLLVFVWPSVNNGHGNASLPIATAQVPAAAKPTVPSSQAVPPKPKANILSGTVTTAGSSQVTDAGTHSLASRNDASSTSKVATSSRIAPVTTAANASMAAAPITNHNNEIAEATSPATASSSTTNITPSTTSKNVSAGTEPAVNTPAVLAASGQDLPADKTPEMLAIASAKDHIQAPSAIHGELIASVVGTGDNKLLDKVTNVARFFAKKKANNK